jgi:hypothetical protein
MHTHKTKDRVIRTPLKTGSELINDVFTKPTAFISNFHFTGVLFSNVYLVEAVSKLGGSTLFNNIYEQTLTFYNGLVFFVMASFAFIAFIILV